MTSSVPLISRVQGEVVGFVRFVSSPTGVVGVAAVAAAGLSVLWSAAWLALVGGVGLLAVIWRTNRLLNHTVQQLDRRVGTVDRRLLRTIDDVDQRLLDITDRLKAADARFVALDRQLRTIERGLAFGSESLQASRDESLGWVRAVERSVNSLERGAVDRLRSLETGQRLASTALASHQTDQAREVEAVRSDGVRRLEEASEELSSKIEHRTSILALAAAALPQSEPISGVLMLMTIHRSGSTRLFDVMRTHPSVKLLQSMEAWDRFDLRGRRYPVAFSNTSDARFAIEIQRDVGAVISEPEKFTLPAENTLATWAVEKAHPQFADFDSAAFLAAGQRMADDGVPLRMVYGIRKPLDAMWSMVEFQRRQPSWQAWLPVEQFPDWIRRSLWSIAEMQAELPGVVVDYEELATGDSLRRLGQSLEPGWSEETASRWLEHAVSATDKAKRTESAGTGFLGQPDPDRTLAGPDGLWAELADVISDADQAYELIRSRGSESHVGD